MLYLNYYLYTYHKRLLPPWLVHSKICYRNYAYKLQVWSLVRYMNWSALKRERESLCTFCFEFLHLCILFTTIRSTPLYPSPLSTVLQFGFWRVFEEKSVDARERLDFGSGGKLMLERELQCPFTEIFKL